MTNSFTYLCELCELAQLGSTQPCHLTQLSELPELMLASAVCCPESLFLVLAHALVLGCQLAVKVHIVRVQPVGQVHSWHQQVILRLFFIPSSGQRSADVKSIVSLAFAQSMQVQRTAVNTNCIVRNQPVSWVHSWHS